MFVFDLTIEQATPPLPPIAPILLTLPSNDDRTLDLVGARLLKSWFFWCLAIVAVMFDRAADFLLAGSLEPTSLLSELFKLAALLFIEVMVLALLLVKRFDMGEDDADDGDDDEDETKEMVGDGIDDEWLGDVNEDADESDWARPLSLLWMLMLFIDAFAFLLLPMVFIILLSLLTLLWSWVFGLLLVR